MKLKHKRILFVLTLIVVGVVLNYFSLISFVENKYFLDQRIIWSFNFIGGIFWGIIAFRISNRYFSGDQPVKADMECSMTCNKMIEQYSLTNTLTGLPNRLSFERRFDILMEESYDMTFDILFIDIDGFKIVNDTLGHAAGDEMLLKISDRIKSVTKDKGEIFHIRGDEFLLLVTKEGLVGKPCEIAEELRKAMAIPFFYKERELHLTISIGIATYPQDGYGVDILLKNANLAVLKAKESGKNNYKVYDYSMDYKINKKLDLINSLHRALEKEEFTLYYQPQFDSKTGEIVGLEALIRWITADGVTISPMEFIPLAEETGLIIPIGDWVLKTACAQNKLWQDLGYAPVPVSVNISALQFQENTFVDKVEKVLQETGLEPRWLHLEITESVAIKDTELTINILNKLKGIGLKIALDDFGTGFSSLGYLNKFKINVLKIDSSFIRDIAEDGATITKTIIVLGKSLDMEVIAEGVETKEQLHYLREAGCDSIQGYLFSRPVPPEEVEKMFKKIA